MVLVEGKHNIHQGDYIADETKTQGGKNMSELREELPEEEELEQEEVAVLDDTSAEMLMARIREADEQYEKMKAWYTFQMEKAKTIRDRTRAWAEGCLRHYFDMVPTHDTKTRRTYELPGGTMILAHREPKYTVADEETVPWLEANGLDQMIKKEAAWGKIKKELKVKVSTDGTRVITEDGEIIPGITVTPQEDEFSVKVK